MKTTSKVLISTLAICFFWFVGFFLLIILALQGEGKFYFPLFLILGLLIILLFVLWTKGKKWSSKIMISLMVLIVGSVITGAGYQIHKISINTVPTVNDQEVDLEQYQPFADKSRVVRLNTQSSLQLKDNLPRIDGATALYPLYSSFVQATYPKKEYEPYDSEVSCSKTPEAYENLINGKVDIIFCAKPSEQQIKSAKERGLEFQLTPIGREAFVFFVNRQNPVNSLTSDQIRGIYSGEITDWSQLGSKAGKIKAYQRPENSGSQTMLEKIMEGKKIIDPIREEVVEGMGGIIEETANYRNFGEAIGYSFLFFATEMVKNNKIKLLTIDGVAPSRATIKNRKYPFAADFYAVTCNRNNKNVDRLIDWILSKEGQYLVEGVGYTPVK